MQSEELTNAALAEIVDQLNNRNTGTKGCYLLRNIPEDLRIAVRHRAIDEGITFRGIILKALKQYLENNKKERDDNNQDANKMTTMTTMTTMTMIEDGDCNIKWECSNCKALIKDKAGFEDKVKVCPKCKQPITQFITLYNEEEV